MKFWLFILSTILISACARPDRQAVDKLNSQSYAYHYRNLDSTEAIARRSYELAANYPAGRAEALNNMAFVNIVRMRYNDAEQQLNDVIETTDNTVADTPSDVEVVVAGRAEAQGRHLCRAQGPRGEGVRGDGARGEARLQDRL